MSAGLPPRALRRLVIDPLWVPVAAALAAVLVVAAVLATIAAPITPRRRVLRIAALGLVYLWLDVKLVLVSLALWLRHPVRHDEQWLDRHAALLGSALTTLLAASGRLLGYRVEVDRLPVGDDRPLVVLARHAGPGDSFSLVQLLTTRLVRRPVVVLKAALQWDPGVDIVLNRLRGCFLPSGTGAGDDRVEMIADAAGRLIPGDALLLFPEGGNWTPRRHRRAVIRLMRAGLRRQAAQARDHPRVLPPRPAGTIATLQSCPQADVLVVVHTGLDTLVNPAQMWAAIPLRDRPMRVSGWLCPAASVPRDAEKTQRWLEVQWARVDEWVAAERS
ncbi:MAG: 1-acyl-sn-glycerol-3-phosphate acyltransferase [Actinobacteria bacterium]|nr:1-acyl-sn-glycerol-3-phosphate acyltransferase [Actinomycetota bacterium]